MRPDTIEFFTGLKLPPDGIIRTAQKRGISQPQIEKAMDIYRGKYAGADLNPMKVVGELCGIARQQTSDGMLVDAKQFKALTAKNKSLMEQLVQAKGDSDSRLMRWLFCLLFTIVAAECLFLGVI